jgi:hypothetical protein
VTRACAERNGLGQLTRRDQALKMKPAYLAGFSVAPRPVCSRITSARTRSGVGEGKAETVPAAPVMIDRGDVADVELPQQAHQIRDMPIETMRLLANRLLGQPNPIISEITNHAPANSRQRFRKFPVQESQSGLPRKRTTGSPAPSST